MANFNFSLVGGIPEENKERTEKWPLERQEGEDELSFYNRKAVAYAISFCRGNYHGLSREEFQKEIENFTQEWQEVIDRDPLIGNKP